MKQEILEAAASSVLCWLATVDSSGMPNVSPKEVFRVYGEEIIVANIVSPGSAANIRSSGKACLSFVNVITQKGWKCSGPAREYTAGETGFEERFRLLVELAGSQFPIKSVLRVTVTSWQKTLAPSSLLVPGTTEKSRIERALANYGASGYTGR